MELSERSKQLRRDAVNLMVKNGGYHVGGTLSTTEILIALFDHVMTPDDIFILSKGHGSWVYYTLLLERGASPKLVGHPVYDPASCVAMTSGSLGHGLPYGAGIALGKKLQGRPGRVFVLLGDADVQEGTFWETLQLARKFELGNLVAIVDKNGIQGSGRVSEIQELQYHTLFEIVKSNSWTAVTVDGHDIDTLVTFLGWDRDINQPKMIIALTTKGKGVSFMENSPEWHAKFPSPDELQRAMKELS